jgi:hypothetical protein
MYQNIRGLTNESDELTNSFVVNHINPHILRVSNHHMGEENLFNITLVGYSIGSSYYYHQNLKKGGLCIFVREDQSYSKISEVCSIQL